MVQACRGTLDGVKSEQGREQTGKSGQAQLEADSTQHAQCERTKGRSRGRKSECAGAAPPLAGKCADDC